MLHSSSSALNHVDLSGLYFLLTLVVNLFLAMKATAESVTTLTSNRLVLSNSGTEDEEVDELVVLVVVVEEWLVVDDVVEVLLVVEDEDVLLVEKVVELLVTVSVEYRKDVVAPICVPLPPQDAVTV
jgi:hypothetical protein